MSLEVLEMFSKTPAVLADAGRQRIASFAYCESASQAEM